MQLAGVFGARLAEARQLRGLSQRSLGELVGLSKKVGSSRINRYEHGRSFVTLKSLNAIAEVLDVPVASLLADTEAMAEAVRLLGTVPLAEQTRLAAALRALIDDPSKVDALISPPGRESALDTE